MKIGANLFIFFGAICLLIWLSSAVEEWRWRQSAHEYKAVASTLELQKSRARGLMSGFNTLRWQDERGEWQEVRQFCRPEAASCQTPKCLQIGDSLRLLYKAPAWRILGESDCGRLGHDWLISIGLMLLGLLLRRFS